jgi:YgiT-type zinc finger domain-containing protein
MNEKTIETMIETKVNYTLERQGLVYVIEHVPARVCRETGETFFSPETVEHIQNLLRGNPTPARIIQTPVFEYA